MKKYNLEVNRDQLQTIKRALEFYSRIGMGQLNEVTSWEFNFKDLNDVDRRYTEDALGYIGELLTDLPRNAYRGIGHRDVPDSCTSAFDMYQVIRHHIAWEDHPEGGLFVQFDTPMKFSKQPLAKIETCDDKDT